MKKFSLSLIFILISLSLFSQLIPKGASWKYLDDGSNQGTAWQKLNYDDSQWKSGNAQLGYGDGDEATIISYGNDKNKKHTTYYFRKMVTVQNPELKNGLKLEILRDDGAVVYINGEEVVRSNMNSGTITSSTFAAHTVSGSAEDKFFTYNISSSYLVEGQNIVAVEVHQRSYTSSDVSFDFKLDFTDLSLFRKAPYLLYPGDNTSMIILWQLHNTATCYFEFGKDTTYVTGKIPINEYGDDHQFKIEIADLEQETKYYYRVTADNEIKTGDFYTGVADDQTSFTFFAYGDTRTYPDKHDLVAKRIMSYVNDSTRSQTFIVSTGDLVSDGNSESDWDGQFFDPSYKNIQNMLSHLPYLASMGNHEGNGKLFAKYFPYPMYAGARYYYSFDYGNVHFTVLDQFSNYAPGSPQYKWLVNDLKTTTKPWKILVLHKPGWSADGGHENSGIVQTYVQPLCKQYGVQFVLAGHNHYYARARVDGIHHITTGGGGAPLYYPNPNYDSIVIVDESYHFCKFDINDDKLIFSAIRYNGSIIESFEYINTQTGIEEIKNNNKVYDIDIYEKGNKLVVENNESNTLVLTVYDLMGQMIYKHDLLLGYNEVILPKSGIYLSQVTGNNRRVAIKKVYIK